MSKALINVGNKCPICKSSARREIDAIISLARGTTGNFDGEQPSEPMAVEEVYGKVKRLLSEIPHDTEEFDEADFVIHLTQHDIVSDIKGVRVKQEGALLFVGDSVRNAPDLQVALMSIISTGLDRFLADPKLINPNLFIKAVELAWRMNSGLAKMDEFLMALQNLAEHKPLPPDSPLGAALADHLQKKQQALLAAKNGNSGTDGTSDTGLETNQGT